MGEVEVEVGVRGDGMEIKCNGMGRFVWYVSWFVRREIVKIVVMTVD
jgi:hypothetical protein